MSNVYGIPTASNEWPFPWRKPISPYDTDGPESHTMITLDGVVYSVAPTGHSGSDTGRARYLTVCLACSIVLHRNTTGPSSYILNHHNDHKNKRAGVTSPTDLSAESSEKVEALLANPPPPTPAMQKAAEREQAKWRSYKWPAFALQVELHPGPTCYEHALHLVEVANRLKLCLHTTFNGVDVTVYPDADPEKLTAMIRHSMEHEKLPVIC